MLDSIVALSSTYANIATVLGVPIALFIFYWEKRKERLAREYATYDALDEKYISFLEGHLQWPELDVYDPSITMENWTTLSRVDKRRQQILYQILISIMERAYLMYHDKRDKIRKSQYEGWHAYMKAYAATPNFQYAWTELKMGEQFQSDFVYEMEDLIKSSRKRILPAPNASS